MSSKFKNLKTDSLPPHWSADFFGNLVDYKLGKTPPRASAVYWKEGKYPWVSISDMIPHGVVTETAEKVSQVAYDTVFRGKLVPKGSQLMSFKLTIGRMSRLREQKKFMVMVTENSKDSRWVPWELGFADPVKGMEHIAILPISDNGSFAQNEYMKIYPKIQRVNDIWWVWIDDPTSLTQLTDWLKK